MSEFGKAIQTNTTVTVRYDLSPATTEGAIRDKLIEMGWTPPDAADINHCTVRQHVHAICPR